jgi:hypothetical protein
VARELFLAAPPEEDALLPYLVASFRRYSLGVQSIHRLLNYVNRHFVKRAVDEDRGWLRLADVWDAVVQDLKVGEDVCDAPERVAQQLRARRAHELAKWGYAEGAPDGVVAKAEACAEAASAPDRVVPLSSLGYRSFRIQVVEPLMAVPKGAKGKAGKAKAKAGSSRSAPALPRARLARSAKAWLESTDGDEDEKRQLARALADCLRMVGVRNEQPLRVRLEKYLSNDT